MRPSDFAFDLPPELIAQTPLARRSDSRLLVLGAEGIRHQRFADVASLLSPGDLLVVNDTRVIPARLRARKDSGGAAEILLERIESDDRALVQVRVSKALRPGGRLLLEDGAQLVCIDREGPFYRLEHAGPRTMLQLFEALGEVPLPPYIERAPDADDRTRYQTVFADRPGAVAAPTASLHFDTPLLERLNGQGIERVALTLHVGAGTFQPLRSDDLEAHVMHAEWLEVPQPVLDAIAATRARGGRVVAVGTTVVRALETAFAANRLQAPFRGETRLFIRPGFRFRAVDELITNFHLPESTLLMLVSAFAGHARVMAAYAEAVRERYRFFSYGDAMFLSRAEDDA